MNVVPANNGVNIRMIDISWQDHGIIENCLDTTWVENFYKKLQIKENLSARQFPEWNTQIGSMGHRDLSLMFAEKTKNINGLGIPVHITLKFRSGHIGPHCDFPLVQPFGQPNKTLLIPLNNFERSSTVVFNEQSECIIGASSGQEIIKNFHVLSNTTNCDDFAYLAHVPSEVKKRLSVKKSLPWKKNSILFWNSDLLHCSCAFDPDLFGGSRDALIIWTKQGT